MNNLAEMLMTSVPLKILHIASHHGVFRGGAVQMCRMALEQSRRGHAVQVVAYSGEPDLSPEEKRLARNSWKPLLEAAILVSFLDCLSWMGRWQLRRFLRKNTFDVVHAHRDEALVATWWAMQRMRGPALISQRGTINPSERPARRALASSKVRAIVAVSEAVRQSVGEYAGAEAMQKTSVVYGSVDLEAFAPRPPDLRLRERIGCPADAFIIGSLSAYRRAKGFDILLKALRPVLTKNPRARALFLGKGVEEHIRPIAEELAIGPQCHFVGHQANVADWLSTMDLTTIAADAREGLSGVLRESLAMEVPVISTDCAGNREIVLDHETGLLVPAKNAEALSQAFSWAIEHPLEMKTMARAGRQWVEHNCSLKAQADRLEAIYQSAMER